MRTEHLQVEEELRKKPLLIGICSKLSASPVCASESSDHVQSNLLISTNTTWCSSCSLELVTVINQNGAAGSKPFIECCDKGIN